MATERLAPQLFILLPPSTQTTDEHDKKWKQLTAAAKSLDWEVRVIRARAVTSAALGEANRRLRVLDPWDAVAIYRAAHRRMVAVVQFLATEILINPRHHPSASNTMSVERFARHKMYFVRLPSPRNEREITPTVADFVAGFHRWIDECDCENDRDPRCLPMHSFSASDNWTDLGTLPGNARFENQHGRPTALRDTVGRVWRRPQGLHGREVLTVAGFDLQPGFHWDVQNTGNVSSLFALHEVWKFPKDSYVNVNPDGAVRQGQSQGNSAKRTFVSPRPSNFLSEMEDSRAVVPQIKQGRRRSRGKRK